MALKENDIYRTPATDEEGLKIENVDGKDHLRNAAGQLTPEDGAAPLDPVTEAAKRDASTDPATGMVAGGLPEPPKNADYRGGMSQQNQPDPAGAADQEEVGGPNSDTQAGTKSQPAQSDPTRGGPTGNAASGSADSSKGTASSSSKGTASKS
jgi:hypothetical protein